MIKNRVKRSEFLTKEEKKSLKQFVKKHKVMYTVAGIIGIPRQSIERLLLKGSASPATVEKVREVLNNESVNA